jgi:copper transport protein
LGGWRRQPKGRVGLPTAIIVAGGLVTGIGSPAFAHASLIDTNPAHGAELDEAPVEIRLRFNEQVTVASDGVTLRDAEGAVLPTAPATISPVDPTTVLLPVPSDLGNGRYIVAFRVISADSHPVAGAIAFGVGMSAGSLEDFDFATGDRTVSVVFAVSRWTSYAGLALLAGGLAFFVLCWPGGWMNQRARRLVTVGWGASLAGGVAVLLLQGPYGAGRSLTHILDPALLAATVDSDYGRYLLVRLGLVVAAAALVFAPRREPTRWHSGGALAVGVALPTTWVGTGHAATSERALDTVADVAHLVAMSTWFGGLTLLLVCVLPRSAQLPTDEVGPMLRRFSQLATAAVATLVVTGTYLAWLRVGTLDALLGTPYGRLLAFKLAALGLLLWLGGMSRSVVQRRYGLRPPSHGTQPTGRSQRRAARAAEADDTTARAQLRQSVRLEVGAAVAVLAVASVLVATPPGTVVTVTAAGAAEAARSLPVLDEQVVGPEGSVMVLVDPARVGENRIVVELADPFGDPWVAPEAWGTFHLPGSDNAAGIGPLHVDLVEVHPGVYEVAGVTLPAAGDWRFTVVVRTTEVDTLNATFTIPVS